MPNLMRETMAMVRASAPDYEHRWRLPEIAVAVHMADLAICEGTSVIWAEHDITLEVGTSTYGLPDDIVFVKSIEHDRGGDDFDHVLDELTIETLERTNMRWVQENGPVEGYLLMSIPGVSGYSKVTLWRRPTVPGRIRIHCTKTRPQAALENLEVPRHIVQQVYFPYVMALLRAGEEPREAAAMMQDFDQGLALARQQYEFSGRVRPKG